MTEPTVVARVRRFLTETTFPDGTTVAHLVTDAHPSLLDHGGLAPYQRVRVPIGERSAFPDLVGQLNDGVGLVAVEAKGTGGLLKGLAQAEQYQEGVQQSFLAAPAARVDDRLARDAERKNLGLLAVAMAPSEEVQPLVWPRARQPWQAPYRSIRQQLGAGQEVGTWSTFTYNVPTHYLAWTLALMPGQWYATGVLPEVIAPYGSMPKGWRAALRGAEKLGLVRYPGHQVRLTPTGAAVRGIVDLPLSECDAIHRPCRYGTMLADLLPRAAAALRILLLHEPMIRLLVRGLRQIEDPDPTMSHLACTCDTLDHDRAPLLFFNPERLTQITDGSGHINWEAAEGIHYRSTTFYQMKRMLQHAGVLKDTGTGANSAKTYDPTDDVWALRERLR